MMTAEASAVGVALLSVIAVAAHRIIIISSSSGCEWPPRDRGGRMALRRVESSVEWSFKLSGMECAVSAVVCCVALCLLLSSALLCSLLCCSLCDVRLGDARKNTKSKGGTKGTAQSTLQRERTGEACRGRAVTVASSGWWRLQCEGRRGADRRLSGNRRRQQRRTHCGWVAAHSQSHDRRSERVHATPADGPEQQARASPDLSLRGLSRGELKSKDLE